MKDLSAIISIYPSKEREQQRRWSIKKSLYVEAKKAVIKCYEYIHNAIERDVSVLGNLSSTLRVLYPKMTMLEGEEYTHKNQDGTVSQICRYRQGNFRVFVKVVYDEQSLQIKKIIIFDVALRKDAYQ